MTAANAARLTIAIIVTAMGLLFVQPRLARCAPRFEPQPDKRQPDGRIRQRHVSFHTLDHAQSWRHDLALCHRSLR